MAYRGLRGGGACPGQIRNARRPLTLWMGAPLLVLAHLYVFQKRSKLRTGVRTIGIGYGALCAVVGFDGVEDREIVRIAHAFEAVVFDDGHVFGRIGLAADRAKCAIEEFKVG